MEEKTRLRTNIVPPDGPLEAKMCFIAQAPGKEENLTLRPLVGSAGVLFDDCCRQVGIARAGILVNNVFAQQPPNNQVGYYFQDSKHTKLTWEAEDHVARLKTWLERLLRMREETNEGPNVLIAMGAEALLVLTGKKRITKWRGSVLPCTLVPGFKVYPTNHPSFVNRLMNEPEEKMNPMKKKQLKNALPTFLVDLVRIQEQAEFSEIRRPKREFTIADSCQEALDKLEELLDMSRSSAIYSGKLYVACDIETLPSSEGPLVWCIGFAHCPEEAFTIPMLRNHGLCWSTKEEALIWRKISEVFLNHNIIIVMHNGFYDMSILGRYQGLRLRDDGFFDTMYSHFAIYPYLFKGLDYLASTMTWEPYYKDDGKVHKGKRISDIQEFLYNCRDCAVTIECTPQLLRIARNDHFTRNLEICHQVAPSLIHKQIRGVKMDVEQKQKLAIEYVEKMRVLKTRIEDDTYEINLNSPEQVRGLVYGYLNLPMKYDRKTKKPTANKDALNALLYQCKEGSDKHRIITDILEYKKIAKLESTYTAMEVDIDGRVRTSYSWISTLRLNSRESHFGGGGNLQNIPVRSEEGRAIRKLFIPDDGKVFLASDLAQAEAREVVWLARDNKLIEAFLAGWDVHWERAKIAFKFPADIKYDPTAQVVDIYTGESHTHKFYRDIAKTVVHAGNYLMGPRMMQTIGRREGVNIDFSVCKQLLQSNRDSNPLTKRWQDDTIEEVKGTRTLVSAFGDKRVFRGRLNDGLFRSAVAFRPQNVVGRLLQIAIQNIFDEISFYEPLMNVHDEVIGQCSEDRLQDATYEIKQRMEIPHEVGDRELIIPADFKWSSKSWGDLKEIELE